MKSLWEYDALCSTAQHSTVHALLYVSTNESNLSFVHSFFFCMCPQTAKGFSIHVGTRGKDAE